MYIWRDISSYSLKLKERFYGKQEHPYRVYERIIAKYINKGDVVVDAGCGREALVLQKLIVKSNILVGLDISGLEKMENNKAVYLITSDLSKISLKDNSIDIVISRSVLEHLRNPIIVYKEINRILKPDGYFIFLTPNFFDYASIAAKIIPNRFHSYIVKRTEGRNEEDTFPTYYKSNTQWAIKNLSISAAFKVDRIFLLGQYPSYFMFNPLFFLIGTLYDKIICKFSTLRFLRGWILAVLQKKS